MLSKKQSISNKSNKLLIVGQGCLPIHSELLEEPGWCRQRWLQLMYRFLGLKAIKRDSVEKGCRHVSTNGFNLKTAQNSTESQRGGREGVSKERMTHFANTHINRCGKLCKLFIEKTSRIHMNRNI